MLNRMGQKENPFKKNHQFHFGVYLGKKDEDDIFRVDKVTK